MHINEIMALTTIDNQETLKLDEVDKKLFYYLSQNIRYPRNELAKKLRVSKEKLNYRIERLLKTIIEPIVLFNFPLFGFKSYYIFTNQLSKERIEQLSDHDEVYLLTQNVGRYNHTIHVVTFDIEQFLKKHLGEEQFEIFEINEYLDDDFNGFHIKDKQKKRKTTNIQSLDLIDYKILAELYQNPIASYLQLANDSGIDRRTIKKRVDQLVENNYIQKFRFIVNAYKTGFQSYLLKIDFKMNQKEELILKLQSNDYSGFMYTSINSLYMWYLPTNHLELFEFTHSVEKSFQGVSIEVIQVSDVHHLSFMPKVALNYFKHKII